LSVLVVNLAQKAGNARLKKLLAEAVLENEVTRDVLRKKW
jgi:putative transposase